MEFKENIKNARLKAKLSQLQVSLKTGITRNSINSYESGRALPNIKKVYVLCKLYKTTPNDLTEFD